MIVLVSIHGIGFQRAPTNIPASDGYADALHEGLRAHLGDVLGDDPHRVAAGGRGPVYAQSNYPPQSNATEPGVNRLGTWTDGGSVDTTGKPLARDGAGVAHVALVYSGLEEQTGDVAALLGMDVANLPSLTSYATLGGIAHMAFRDLEALRGHPAVSGPPASSLEPRTDATIHRGIVDRLLRKQPDAAVGAHPPGALGTLRVVEDDIAAYVIRNEHRERVRAFLRDATSRLVARADVEGVVINGHSNGTVMGFDLIAALSPPSARRVRALITSGSPLRKYSELLDWGRDAGNMRLMTGRWTNFWDPLDPVADPLSPADGWRRGQPIPTDDPGMFLVHDPGTGVEAAMPVIDIVVDNVKDSKGGGLRAHNYWDNDAYCGPAAQILTASAHAGQPIAAGPA